jgi:hypothetical protein
VRPETRYARSSGLSIAYQVLGDGPLDLLLVHGFVSHLDVAWEEPHLSQFLNRLASFSRLILFDKRGTGLSDPVGEPPTFAERMEDIRAVLDAVGSASGAVRDLRGRPAVDRLLVHLPGADLGADHVRLIRPLAARRRLPVGPVARAVRGLPRGIDRARETGSGGSSTTRPSPTSAKCWWARYPWAGASPGATRRWSDELGSTSGTSCRAPRSRRSCSTGRTSAGSTSATPATSLTHPRRQLVELPGIDHVPWVGDARRSSRRSR